MGLFNVFLAWVKARLHVKPTELKGAPGVSNPADAANHVNAVVGVAVDTAGAAGPAAVENALKIHPAQLSGAPGIDDHVAAADAINAIVQSKIEGS